MAGKGRYPGYKRFFSSAAGIFGVGRRPTRRPKRRPKPRERLDRKPETALAKSLSPRKEGRWPLDYKNILKNK